MYINLTLYALTVAGVIQKSGKRRGKPTTQPKRNEGKPDEQTRYRKVFQRETGTGRSRKDTESDRRGKICQS
jgi:hypothetical protein